MGRYFQSLLAPCLGAFLLAACGSSDADLREDWPSPTPAIWQITSPEGQTAWLLGTVHSLPDGVEWRSPPIETAFAKADLLVVEIADLANTQASFSAFRQSAYRSSEGELLLRVDGTERELLADLVERAGADADDFHEMDSWAAALVLAGGVRNGDPENGVDRALIASGKPVHGLESFEEQYAIFDTLPKGEQADLLIAIAREAQVAEPEQSTQMWLTGDLQGLERLAKDGMLADPELRAALLVDRNRDWLQQITALIDEGRKPFIAVGAAHMLGDSGLPAMLTQAGYSVERLQ